MGKRLALSGLVVLLLVPSVAMGDCLDIGNYTAWVAEDGHTVIFYDFRRPIARLTIPYCTVSSSAKILLSKSFVCDSDTLVVDGRYCTIITVEILY